MLKERKKIGIALGSGGFRGLAHIGVLKVLEENGIRPDYISGASVGAIVSAYYAVHGNAKDLERNIDDWPINSLYKFIDLNWRGGFIAGKKIYKFLDKEFASKTFAKTKIPLQIIATDLEKGTPFVFSSGRLAPAVRASISVPLMLKPASHEGKQFIDGGLCNPVPLDLLRDMGAEILIGVNLYHKNEFVSRNFTGTNVILRSARIVMYNLAQADILKADIVITPDTSPIIVSQSLKKYNRESVDKLIKIGETAAKKVLPELRALINGEVFENKK